MLKHTTSTTHAPLAKRPWLWMVMVGFLWLQFAGTAHRYDHDPQTAKAVVMATTATHFAVEKISERLLPEHSTDDEAACQLLDLQCSGLALGFAAPVIAALDLHTAFERLRFLSRFSLPSQNYQARAPPKP